MTRRAAALVPCLAVLVASACAAPASAADAAQGERLARRWCAECHVVAPDQTRARADAPSFAAISATRRIPQIEGFLRQNHPQMPDMSLSRDEIANLIAWMQSLAPALDPARPAPQKDEFELPRGG
jgi:mono/diheme cytochrome c family protein